MIRADEFWNERTLVTIFSAPSAFPLSLLALTGLPDYCGEFDNFAAVMSVSEDLVRPRLTQSLV